MLQNIKGTQRRALIRDYWNAGRFQELEDVLLQDDLTEAQRNSLGRIHPSFLGGEFLPRARRSEITIVRIDLKSVTADVIEVRAAPAGKRIRYRVVDEYATRFCYRPASSRNPLTLGQLIDFIDHANPGSGFGEGLALCYTAVNYSCGGSSLDSLESFTRIGSDVYRDLSAHYSRVQRAWFQARRQEQAQEATP
ncbi:MAG: hypothetical protein JW395_2994 [Nitrospira sp.]|nr:hypothetical protein [Nitrospira sp.]